MIVHFANGDALPGKIVRYAPDQVYSYKVVFDDPLVYGGTGAGWFEPAQVALPGERRIGWMTVEELITKLGELPADADVCLSAAGQEIEDFTVELSTDGWVVLDG